MSVRAIARKLGISPTAVSLALKDSPRVSEPLRKKIQDVARSSGYVPNAKLSELMAEVRKAISPTYHATLGAFSLYPEERPWEAKSRTYLKQLLDSATACAQTHGYKLEYFWYKKPGMSGARFKTILEARGIQGLLCLGGLEPTEGLPKELRRFAVATFSVSVPGKIHRVSSHFMADAHALFDQLLRRGYKRPGLCIPFHGDWRTDHAYSAAFLSMQERLLPKPHLPVLRSDVWDEAQFHQWFSEHRPDVIVLHQDEAYIAGTEHYLKRKGLKVPSDIGIVLLDKNPDRSRYSGMCQNMPLMGLTLVELLIGRILLRDFKAPENPKVEVVVGEWNEGRTLVGLGHSKHVTLKRHRSATRL